MLITWAEIGHDFPWCTVARSWPALHVLVTSKSPFLASAIREREMGDSVWQVFLSMCRPVFVSPSVFEVPKHVKHTHTPEIILKNPHLMFHWAQTRRAVAMAIKLAFRVTALSNLYEAGCMAAATEDVAACGSTHTHTRAACCRGRWIRVQIVSDMVISSPSLTGDASAIKVKGRQLRPSMLSYFSTLLVFSSW